MLFEALLEDGRLVPGEPQLLPGSVPILLVADSPGGGPLVVCDQVLMVGFPLAPLPRERRDGAVWRGDRSFALAVRCRGQPVDVNPTKERAGFSGAPICRETGGIVFSLYSKPSRLEIILF